MEVVVVVVGTDMTSCVLLSGVDSCTLCAPVRCVVLVVIPEAHAVRGDGEGSPPPLSTCVMQPIF